MEPLLVGPMTIDKARELAAWRYAHEFRSDSMPALVRTQPTREDHTVVLAP